MLTESSPSGLDDLAKEDLVLPEELIPEMRKPLGKLLKDARSLKISGSKKVVTVGDQCTLSLIGEGIEPDLAIVDYKTKREKIELAQEINGFGDVVLKLRNPAGSISREAWEVLESAFATDKKVRIDVEGEEDLLALPSIMIAPLGTTVIYGMPSQGLVVVHVDERIKNKVSSLIRRMVKKGGD